MGVHSLSSVGQIFCFQLFRTELPVVPNGLLDVSLNAIFRGEALLVSRADQGSSQSLDLTDSNSFATSEQDALVRTDLSLALGRLAQQCQDL